MPGQHGVFSDLGAGFKAALAIDRNQLGVQKRLRLGPAATDAAARPELYQGALSLKIREMRRVVLSQNFGRLAGIGDCRRVMPQLSDHGGSAVTVGNTKKSFGQPANCFGMGDNQKMVVGAAVQRNERIPDTLGAGIHYWRRLPVSAATRTRCMGTSRRRTQTGTAR